jgi:hypothetical protein
MPKQRADADPDGYAPAECMVWKGFTNTCKI